MIESALDSSSIGQQKAVVVIDAPLEDWLFEDIFRIGGVPLHHDSELLEWIDNDETVAVLSEELLEVPECFGWNLESVLLTVVLSFARWYNDISVAEMNTRSGLLADSSNQPSNGLAVIG